MLTWKAFVSGNTSGSVEEIGNAQRQQPENINVQVRGLLSLRWKVHEPVL
tara:strand:+ start:298 stop:447 length:150 start_codon:yes stop_codon:yes gene_type:complete